MLDEALDLYRNNFVLILGIVTAIQIPMTLLGWLIEPPRVVNGKLPADFWHWYFTWMGYVGVWACLSALSGAALTAAVSNRYLGRRANLAGCYRAAGRLWLRLLGLGFVKWLWVTLAFCLLIIPGIIAYVSLALAFTVMILEDTGVAAAMDRARYLMRGNIGRGFIFFMLLLLFELVFGLQPGVLNRFVMSSAHQAEWTTRLFAMFTTVLIQPIWTIATVVLYYDFLVRKEAFDITLLAETLPTAA